MSERSFEMLGDSSNASNASNSYFINIESIKIAFFPKTPQSVTFEMLFPKANVVVCTYNKNKNEIK